MRFKMPKNLEEEAQVFVKTASKALNEASKTHNRNSANMAEQAKLCHDSAKYLEKIASKGSGEKLDSVLSTLLQASVGVGKDTTRTVAIADATIKILGPEDNIPLLVEAIGKVEGEHNANFLSQCFSGGHH
jgi:predicted sugar kinase